MKRTSVTASSAIMKSHCPFCYKRLRAVASIRFRIKKICKCPNCGKIIDNRYVIH